MLQKQSQRIKYWKFSWGWTPKPPPYRYASDAIPAHKIFKISFGRIGIFDLELNIQNVLGRTPQNPFLELPFTNITWLGLCIKCNLSASNVQTFLGGGPQTHPGSQCLFFPRKKTSSQDETRRPCEGGYPKPPLLGYSSLPIFLWLESQRIKCIRHFLRGGPPKTPDWVTRGRTGLRIPVFVGHPYIRRYRTRFLPTRL